MSTPLSHRALRAIRLLTSTTHLGTLPAVAAAFDADRQTLDFDRLADWSYSSGELVLVDALRAFATGRGGPALADGWTLDTETRQAYLAAVVAYYSDGDAEVWT